MATTDHGHDPHGHQPAPHGHGPINHEQTDINLEGVGKLVIGFAVLMTVLGGIMYGTMLLFDRRDAVGQRPLGSMVEPATEASPPMLNPPNEMVGARAPAGPRLLTNEPANLQQYRAGITQRLHSYGWVDRANDVVHMPIERAIALTVERGLPVAPAAEAAPTDETMPAEGEVGETPAPEGEAAPPPPAGAPSGQD